MLLLAGLATRVSLFFSPSCPSYHHTLSKEEPSAVAEREEEISASEVALLFFISEGRKPP